MAETWHVRVDPTDYESKMRDSIVFRVVTLTTLLCGYAAPKSAPLWTITNKGRQRGRQTRRRTSR